MYAGVRYDDTDEWQESWMPKEVYGARRGVEALDATWDMALDIEESYLRTRELVAALLDNCKCFDFFLRHIMWPTLVHLGAPLRLIQTVMRFYDGAIRFFKIGQHCGKTFHPSNGLGQGCPLSMRWVNGTGGVWVIKMQCVNPDLRMSGYVDDRTLRANAVNELEDAVYETITYDGHWG